MQKKHHKYKFDTCPRFFKELPRLDKDMQRWSMIKFLLMKECIELCGRFGNSFYFGVEDFASHLRVKRWAISKYLGELDSEGWLEVKMGKYTGHKTNITVKWDKLDSLYQTYEKDLRSMERGYQSVVRDYAVGKKSYPQSVVPNYAVSQTESVVQNSESVVPNSKSVVSYHNNKNDNGLDNNTSSKEFKNTIPSGDEVRSRFEKSDLEATLGRMATKGMIKSFMRGYNPNTWEAIGAWLAERYPADGWQQYSKAKYELSEEL